MATIQEYSVPNPTSGLTPLQRFTSWFFRVFIDNPITGCCFQHDELEMFHLDRQIRADIRRNLRTHYVNDVMDAEGNSDSIATAVRDVYEGTGYDLGGQPRANPEGVPPHRNVQAIVVRTTVDNTVRVIPRFAAACVTVLRVRLGVLGRTDANLLLVQREYLRICRRRGIRSADILSHQMFVMNAFFTEDVFERVAQSRRRLPIWARLAYPWREPGVSIDIQ